MQVIKTLKHLIYAKIIDRGKYEGVVKSLLLDNSKFTKLEISGKNCVNLLVNVEDKGRDYFQILIKDNEISKNDFDQEYLGA